MKPEAEKTEPAKKQPAKTPEKDTKPPTPYEEMLDKFATAKPLMRKKAGDDSVYQAGLETLGVKHANEINKEHNLTIEDGNKLLEGFREYLFPKKEAEAT